MKEYKVKIPSRKVLLTVKEDMFAHVKEELTKAHVMQAMSSMGYDRGSYLFVDTDRIAGYTNREVYCAVK